MLLRLIFVMLLYSASVICIRASTVTFLHDEESSVSLKDAVHTRILSYAPQFKYPTSTIFHLGEPEVKFYLLNFNSMEYYLWIDDLSQNIEINLSELEVSNADFVLISKSDWLAGKLNTDISTLKHLNEIDLYYANALDSLNNLARSDDQFRAEMSYNTVVWDSRSAKRLYNVAIEEFSYEFDKKVEHYSPSHIPSYVYYWHFLYKLYYQYFHTNSFKGLSKKEIKSKLEEDFQYPESKTLLFHHFFREGLPLSELKENYIAFNKELSPNQRRVAEAMIQNAAVENLSSDQSIDFLFGIDIDGAMEGYFARDSSENRNVLIFWSTWDSHMANEFNLLRDLKETFKDGYNFIHICIDAYETPEKTKSFIYQNRVGGYHLLPEQTNAFRKSNFRKDLKIRDLPFYVLADSNGKIIETESIPLRISSRLENKLQYFSTKK